MLKEQDAKYVEALGVAGVSGEGVEFEKVLHPTLRKDAFNLLEEAVAQEPDAGLIVTSKNALRVLDASANECGVERPRIDVVHKQLQDRLTFVVGQHTAGRAQSTIPVKVQCSKQATSTTTTTSITQRGEIVALLSDCLILRCHRLLHTTTCTRSRTLQTRQRTLRLFWCKQHHAHGTFSCVANQGAQSSHRSSASTTSVLHCFADKRPRDQARMREKAKTTSTMLRALLQSNRLNMPTIQHTPLFSYFFFFFFKQPAASSAHPPFSTCTCACVNV